MHQHPSALKLKHITLAISLALTAELALAQEPTIIEKIDLGTLKTDNSGMSIVYTLSTDGTVAGTCL